MKSHTQLGLILLMVVVVSYWSATTIQDRITTKEQQAYLQERIEAAKESCAFTVALFGDPTNKGDDEPWVTKCEKENMAQELQDYVQFGPTR